MEYGAIGRSTIVVDIEDQFVKSRKPGVLELSCVQAVACRDGTMQGEDTEAEVSARRPTVIVLEQVAVRGSWQKDGAITSQ